MQIKLLGSLVLTIQKEVKSAGIDFDKLKQLLILSYPLEKEIQEAKSFAHVFVAVYKHCSPVNITDHFKLTNTLPDIQPYKLEKQNYHKKFLSTQNKLK